MAQQEAAIFCDIKLKAKILINNIFIVNRFRDSTHTPVPVIHYYARKPSYQKDEPPPHTAHVLIQYLVVMVQFVGRHNLEI